MIIAYREPDRAKGRTLMSSLIDALSRGVPAALTELITLGRILNKRADDVLAHFDRPGTSNGPTEAVNGRLGNTSAVRPRLPQPHQPPVATETDRSLGRRVVGATEDATLVRGALGVDAIAIAVPCRDAQDIRVGR